MKTLLKYIALILAVALPVAFLTDYAGLSYFGAGSFESVLAAFASAGVLLMVVSDYSYRRSRDAFSPSSETVLRLAECQLRATSVNQNDRCRAPLTAAR